MATPTMSAPCALVFEADTSARFLIHQVLVKLGWASYLPPAFEPSLVRAFGPSLVMVGRMDDGVDRRAALAMLKRESRAPLALLAAYDDRKPTLEETQHADIVIDRPFNAKTLFQTLTQVTTPLPA